MPPAVEQALEEVAGFSLEPTQIQLALQLLRPALILCALVGYRWLFGLGTLREQLEGQIMGPEGLEQKR